LASNNPTTFHMVVPKRSSEPTSAPPNSACAPRPMINSLRPHANIRPSTIFTSGRMAKALGSTPRRGTLAVVLVVRFGRSTITKSSGDTSGLPSAPRATPGASRTASTSVRVSTEVISLSAPERMTSAVSGLPPTSMTVRNPSAIESRPTSTITTKAMPVTATAAEPIRDGSERKLNASSAAICRNAFITLSSAR
jgi:hypothetical protein